MKQSVLDHAGVHGGAHYEQRPVSNSSPASHSPSRRSPKSPPRSPSWMRHHRDSPPRTISPSISPTERFPESTFVDRPRPLDKLQVEEYEIRLDDGREFDFDVVMAAAGDAGATTGGVRATLPPKPARSDVYRLMAASGDDSAGARPNDDESSVLNVASYAAAIASDTAHLTRLSVSPLGFDASDASAKPSSLGGQPAPVTTVSTAAGATLAEPTPKTIDYQNARRQKGKPPSPSAAGTDWSPLSDLSPIIDVSPSIERIEQDRMSAGGISRLAPAPGVRVAPSGDVAGRRVLPNAPQQTLPADVAPGTGAQYVIQRQPGRTDAAPEDVYRASDMAVSEQEGAMMRSSLKRCPNFDNISSISSVNDASALQPSVRQESANILSPASGSRPRTSESIAVPVSQSKFIAVEAGRGLRPATTAGSVSDARTEAERTRQESAADSLQSQALGDSQQQRSQDSSRRQTVDIATSTDRDQRSLKAGAPAPSALDSSARKQPSHAETAAANAKEPSIDKPSSEAVVQNKQSEMTAKSATSREDSSASEVKKTRRRLPPVPVDAETATTRPARRIRSRSADSRVDEASVEKERLRRHLKLREVR